jgi:Gpi18-like mannosyltransferase
MFQLLAEQYMGPREALYAALLMGTFPYVSVFTTLSYSESVFLFFSISTWYFCKKGRIGVSSLFAGVASLTRIYGFAIVLPVLLHIIKCKSYRKLFYLLIPTAFISLWMLFCYLSTGDPLVSWTDQKYWVFDSKSSLGEYVLSEMLQGIKGTLVFNPAILVTVALFAFLVLKTWEVDRLLWVYAVSMFGALCFTTVNHLSLLRYFPFIFPIWLTLKVRNPLVVAVCIAFFIPLILILWLYNLSVIFIG